jgi:hypothetical protein
MASPELVTRLCIRQDLVLVGAISLLYIGPYLTFALQILFIPLDMPLPSPLLISLEFIPSILWIIVSPSEPFAFPCVTFVLVISCAYFFDLNDYFFVMLISSMQDVLCIILSV